ADFPRLHPRLRERFGFRSTDGIACIGTGTMDEVWRGRGFTRPFLAMAARRHILVAETGRDIPFTIHNYAYLDSFGRETMTFTRTFHFDSPRRWDATMVHSAERDTIVDYLGTHQHLAVDLHLSVDGRGGLVIRSGEQRLHEGIVNARVPRLVTGAALLRESYDEEIDRFRIDVTVTNRWFGPLFGYRGTFDVSYAACDTVPAAVVPMREQQRI
ncbi:MAG TPA: DUF4166 domain-containing protein, partial [Pseudonocardiaceae bacterium]